MGIFKRGKLYWFHFHWNGDHIQKSTKQGNPRVARQVEAACKTALAKGEVGIHDRKPVPSLSTAMREFLGWSAKEHSDHLRTHRRYLTSSKPLLRYFKDIRLDRITPGDIENFKTARCSERSLKTGRKLRPATVNRELACLKALLRYGIKNDWLAMNPVSQVKFLPEDNEQMRVLIFDEQRRYLAEASQPLQDVGVVMVETGMRPEEVFRALVEKAHPDEGYLYNPYGKTKAARRRVPLSKAAADVIRARIRAANGPYLFPSRKDPSQPMRSIQNAHSGALKRSGVRPFRLYDLRHTFASRAAMSGIDLVTLAAILGHSRIQMVLRYAHPTEEHQAEAIRKLEVFNAERRVAEYATNVAANAAIQ